MMEGLRSRRPSELAPWVLQLPPIDESLPSSPPLRSPDDHDLPPPSAFVPLRPPLQSPPPFLRNASHPATRALPYALPQRPTYPLAHPPSHNLHGVAQGPKPLAKKLLERVPAGFVPAVGALPSLVGGVRQANEAMAWRRVVRARAAECMAARSALLATQAAWHPATQGAGLDKLMTARITDLTLELRGLDEAASQARFRLANIILELGAVAATALPQLYALTGLAVGLGASHALRRLVPLCLVVSGMLGVLQHAYTLWGLVYQGPPQVPALAPRGSLSHTVGTTYRAERRFHATQTALWLAFTWGMAWVAGPLATGLFAPWLGAGLLAAAIAGVSGQHVWVGERFMAPRTLWTSGAWTCQAFAPPQRQEALWEVFQTLKAERQEAMAGQLASLSKIRAQVLRALGAATFLPGVDWVYGSCVRQWLTHTEAPIVSVLTGLHLSHWHNLRAIRVAQTWALAKALALAQQDAAQKKEGAPKASAGAILALQLAEAERTTMDAEARELTRLIHTLQTASDEEHVWATLAQFYGLPVDGGERLAGTLVLALEAHNEGAILALAYGARIGARQTPYDAG